MPKLKLKIQDLAVASFPVVRLAAPPIGTVHGRVDSLVGEDTCLTGVCTCWDTCDSCPDFSCPTHCPTACPTCQPADVQKVP